MYLSKFQLFNYKSFRDSDLLEFTPGINIIVGENNSGKTALLEALSLQFDDFTHRSIKTLPTNLSAINPKSKVQLWLSFEKNEFRAILDNFSSDFLGIYLPDNNTLVPERLVS
jgi:AAA15 family ATPase/GTPase